MVEDGVEIVRKLPCTCRARNMPCSFCRMICSPVSRSADLRAVERTSAGAATGPGKATAAAAGVEAIAGEGMVAENDRVDSAAETAASLSLLRIPETWAHCSIRGEREVMRRRALSLSWTGGTPAGN